MSIMGKQKRNTLDTSNDAPGPGSYNPLTDQSSLMQIQPKWTMHGTKTREIPIIKDLPGPGQYDPKLTTSSRAPVMGGRFKTNDREERFKPGPGNYNTDISELSKIGFSMGKQKRNSEKKTLSPGPGCYDVDMKKTTPGFKIGKESRSQKEMANTVGPGAYNLPSTLRTDKGFHIVPRRERIYSMITPGPDAYNQLSRERIKSFKIGQSKREGIFKNSESPGPAFYEPRLHLETTQGFTMGKSKKLQNKFEYFPGPGQYEIKQKKSAPKYSMVARYVEKYESIGPGPSAYTLADMKDTKNIIFGHSKRDSGSIDSIPGPGQYNQDFKKQNTAIIFGREKRSFSKVDALPGPGQYQIKSIFDKKK